MGHFIYVLFLAVLVYLLLFGVASLAIAGLRWALLLVFSGLPANGAARTTRQFIAFPMVALLSRERKARAGDCRSIRQLYYLQIVIAGALSWLVQGALVAICGSAFLLVGTMVAFKD